MSESMEKIGSLSLASPSSDLRPCNTMPDLQSPSPREQQQPPPSKMQRIQTYRRQQSAVNPPFAGRVGGNLEFIVDREDPQNASLLKKVPDAAPNLSLRESLDLRGFGQVELYKAAMIEGIGQLRLRSRW